jgi:hypothetical protein
MKDQTWFSTCPDCGEPLDTVGSSAGPALPGTAEPGAVAPTTPKATTGTVAIHKGGVAHNEVVEGGYVEQYADGSLNLVPVAVRPHWMDCQSEEGLHRRIRAGVEPGYVPITFSRIKRWKECAYGEQQENRIPDRIRGHGEKADIGTAVHLVLEAEAKGTEPDLEQLAKLIPLDSREDYDFFLRSAKKFAPINEERPHALFLEDDARFIWEFPVTKDDGSVVIAQVETKMDMLKIMTTEKLAEVVDYKTGRVVSDTVDDDPQGKLYCAAITESEIGRDIEWFDFIQPQLRFWKPGPTARWSRRDIEEFKVLFKMDVEAYVRESRFDTRPGNHCHWCSVAFRCPQGQKMLKYGIQGVEIKVGGHTTPIVTTDEEARAVAQTVIQMKAAVEQIDGWLRAYVKQTGKNIDLGDGTNYGSQIKSSLKLPPEAYDAARQILQESGFNFDDYIRWDMSEGDGWKFIKGKRGKEAGLLKDLAKPEAYSRWEQSKAE